MRKGAVKWYTKAAEQGNAEGQSSLGRMYYFGRGVPQDYIKAYAWSNLAAAQGEDPESRRKAIASMAPQQIAEGQKLSAQLYKKIKSSK